MKKLMYGGLFLAVVGIGFIACEKEIVESDMPNESIEVSEIRINNDNSKIEKRVSLGSFGFIGDSHNSLLEDYFTNGNYINQTSLSDVLLDFFNYHSNQNSAYAQYQNVYLDAINNFQYAYNMTELYIGFNLELLELKNEGQISANDYSVLESILASEDPIQASVTFDDSEMSNAYSSVYDASSFFWTNGVGGDLLDDYGSGDSLAGIDPSVKAIVGDAVGGAMWFWTGPFGPLIAGAYSVACYYSTD